MNFEAYETSSAQVRIYLEHQLHGSTTLYNIPYARVVEGNLDVSRLELAFNRLASRHESLRTAFILKDGEILQLVYDNITIEFPCRDAARQEIHQIIFAFIRPFELDCVPLWRIELVKLDKNRYLLLFDIHHIIADGVSIFIIFNELLAVYQGITLPPLEFQYVDFTLWQNDFFAGEEIKKQEQYWMDIFNGDIPRLSLPIDFPGNDKNDVSGSIIYFEIDPGLATDIWELARSCNVTINLIFLSAYFILLWKYTGQEDIIVGIPVAGRPSTEMENIVGMFVNTLALRCLIFPEMSFRLFLEYISTRMALAFENQDYPFERLVERLNLRLQGTQTQLLQTLFSFFHWHKDEPSQTGQTINTTAAAASGAKELRFIDYPIESKTAKMDIGLNISQLAQSFKLEFEYAVRLFTRQTIQRLAGHYMIILTDITQHPDRLLNQLTIISLQERQQILEQFNNTRSDYPHHKTLTGLLEEQAQRTPDHVALVGKEERRKGRRAEGKNKNMYLSYRELNERSDQLTYMLIEKGVKPGSIAAIMVERSIEMIIGILGILKAGGAYLPIDPDYPQERINYMLADSNAKILLTSDAINRVPTPNHLPIHLSTLSSASTLTSTSTCQVSPANLAYIIYTSGSTGTPKGVLVEHGNVIRLVKNTDYVELNEETRVLQTGAPVFDATTFEIWGSLLNGGRLVLVGNDVILDTGKLGPALTRYDINTLWLSSQIFNRLIEQDSDIFSGLAYLLVGGDVLSPRNINKVRSKNKRLKVINGYGPTENTTFSTSYWVDKDFELSIPIGKPINNSTAYIVDKAGNLQPPGIWGELWVGGDGVARGYLNRPELTAEKFIDKALSPLFLPLRKTERAKNALKSCNQPGTFQIIPGARSRELKTKLYKTGDLASWMPDGNIQFFGRIDSQVKIRGYRIELGEIENHLMKIDFIREAVVIDREDSNAGKYLCAYVVTPKEKANLFNETELRSLLLKRLPAYMVPACFVRLEEIPVTTSGKVDRIALPGPAWVDGSGTYLAPTNPVEKALVQIWSKVLDIEKEKIGIDTDFFKLGGHSIKAIFLVSCIHETFHVDVSMGEIFNNPSIRKLAKMIGTALKVDFVPIQPLEKKEYYLVSHTQKRVWTVCQDQAVSVSYNIPVTYLLEGRLNLTTLEQAFKALLKRHESLRTVFYTVEGEVRQKILPPESLHFHLGCIDLERVLEKEKRAWERVKGESAVPFDLSSGPLLRVLVIRLEEEKHVFFSNMHHVISDFLSHDILSREMLTLYNAVDRERQHQLKPLYIQYKDYAAWHNQRIKGEQGAEHRKYWMEQLGGDLPRLELPRDKKGLGAADDEGDSVIYTIEEELLEKLKDFSEKQKLTLFMMLLTALNVLFYYYTAQTDIVLGIITAGREEADLRDQVGCYLNTLVLRTRFNCSDTFTALLEKVKMVLLGAYQHQIYPFDQLLADRGDRRQPGRHPFFDILVNMLNSNPNQSETLTVDSSSNIHIRDFGHRWNDTKFDLTITLVENERTMEIIFSYKTDIFARSTIQRMVSRFKTLLDIILETPGSIISGLRLQQKIHLPPIQPIPANSSPVKPGFMPLSPKEDFIKANASYHQERLWFIHQFEIGEVYESGPLYHNIPLILELEGPLELNLLVRSLEMVVNRHEALRIRMVTIGNRLFQQVIPTKEIPFKVLDLTAGSGLDSCLSPLEMAIEEAKQPFSLNGESLIRAVFIKISTQKHFLVITLHHLIADRCSLGIITAESLVGYQALRQERPHQLPGLPLQYPDFSKWQQQLPPDLVESQLFYWRRQLAHLTPLELPTTTPRPAIHVFREGRAPLRLPSKLSAKIREFSQQKNTGNDVLLLAAFKILLYHCCGQEDIVVGTTGDYRHLPGTHGMVGPLANLLVLRSRIPLEKAFNTFFLQLTHTLELAYENCDIPFDHLAFELNPTRDMSRTVFFDVLFQYEKQPFPIPGIEDLHIKYIETNLGWGKYDLNILIREGQDSFTGILVYNREYYQDSFVSGFIEHYNALLESILREPDRWVSQLDILRPEERQSLLFHCNRTRARYPEDKTLHQLFKEQVERTPEFTVVVGQTGNTLGEMHLSYRELNKEANLLAGLLIEKCVGPDTIVAIMMERSVEMIIGLLGILKAGGAYLPIDPDYPEERVSYLLADSNARILVTTQDLSKRIDYDKGIIHLLLSHPGHNISLQDTPAHLHQQPVPPTSLAYIIYTSGTTGKPKGCCITHRNVIRLLKTDGFPFHFDRDDTWIMAHSFCFDFSVWEMYGALLNSGKLIVPSPDSVRDIHLFLSLIKRHRVTVLNQTPPAFYALAQVEVNSPEYSLNNHLRYVIFGGDRLAPQNLSGWITRYSPADIQLVNMYGITETTVHVTYYYLKAFDITSPTGGSIIGKPLPESTLYILDNFFNPVPVGISGEIFVGGSGVAPGYLNRVKLTAQRFFENPQRPGEIIYKSGDIGRRLPDGNVEYLGRNDDQIKIRGFRIEPAEIENHLLKLLAVKEAVVIGRKDKHHQASLCAYLRLDPAQSPPTVPRMREYLNRDLPDYMTPAHFVFLDTIPLTPNRKIDRLALPEPVVDMEIPYTAPSNPVEEKLLEIWGEVFDINAAKTSAQTPYIGIDTDFFELGGHSLKATIMISRVHQLMKVKIPIAEVFKTPNIRGLAQYINRTHQELYTPVKPIEKKEYYPLSSAQKRLYLLQQALQSTTYNMPHVISLAGHMDLKRIEEVINQLIRRHESLRTSFAMREGMPVQQVHDEVELKIEYYDLVTEDTESTEKKNYKLQNTMPLSIKKAGAKTNTNHKLQITNKKETTDHHSFIVRPFDLSRAPLLRVGIMVGRAPAQPDLMLVDLHHIIADGVSLRIIRNEFFSLLKNENLSPLPLQYKDYVNWQNSKAQAEAIKRQEKYWLEQLQGEIPLLDLPLDYERPAAGNSAAGHMDFVLGESETETLKTMAKEEKTTLFMVLLAAFTLLLSKLSGQEDIVVGTGSAGRRHADLQRIIGMFVNTLALRNYPTPDKTFEDFLKEVNHRTLQAFENQDYPFEDLVETVVKEREPHRSPLVEAVFTFQTIDDETVLSGHGHRQRTGNANDYQYDDAYEYMPAIAKFDLLMGCVENSNELFFGIEYHDGLFKEKTIRIMIDNFKEILSGIVKNRKIRLKDIDLSHGLGAIQSNLMKEEEGDFKF